MNEQFLERQSKEFLQENQSLFRRIVDTAQEGIWMLDINTKTSYVNRRMADMLGYTSDEMLGCSFLEFMDADARTVAEEQFERRRQGLKEQHDFRFRRKDGTSLWALIATNPVFAEDGNFVGVLGMLTDITERKRVEEEHDRFFTLSVDMMCVAGFDGYFKRLNPAFERTLGYTTAELFERPFLEFVHPDDHAATLTEVQKLTVGESVTYLENRYRCRDGSYRWLSWTATPVVAEGVLYAIARDITRLKQTEGKLIASETLYRQLFETAQDGILILDFDTGRIKDANPFLVKLLGYSYNELLEKKIWEIGLLRDIAASQSAFQILQSQGYIRYEDLPLETKDKRQIEVEFISNMYRVGHQEVIQCNIRDITARKQIEAELKAFSAKLEQSNRELQDFASVASHDLQEPLRKIQAFGDRLKIKCNDALTDEGKDYLERMQNAAKRMQVLINDLLAFSRITTKAQPFVPVNLNKVVQEVLSDLEVHIQRVNGQVDVQDLPTIDADPLQMRQLLQNLLSNAMKFCRGDEVPNIKIQAEILEIEPSSARRASALQCQLTVTDNGIGFDEKYLDRIFTVFQRLHSRNEYEGTGIGLAICRKITERHGGNITAKSILGQGTTFIVTLPLKQKV